MFVNKNEIREVRASNKIKGDSLAWMRQFHPNLDDILGDKRPFYKSHSINFFTLILFVNLSLFDLYNFSRYFVCIRPAVVSPYSYLALYEKSCCRRRGTKM